jgi:hypothetical protein
VGSTASTAGRFPRRVWLDRLAGPALIVAAVLALTTISAIRYYVVSRQDEALAE